MAWQCELLSRSRRIGERYPKTPFYGSRRTALVLAANRKRMLAADAVDGLTGSVSEAAPDACGYSVTGYALGSPHRSIRLGSLT